MDAEVCRPTEGKSDCADGTSDDINEGARRAAGDGQGARPRMTRHVAGRISIARLRWFDSARGAKRGAG